MISASKSSHRDSSAKALRNTSFWFAAVALLCLSMADLDISTPNPWGELGLMAAGALSPTVWSWPTLLTSLANTFSFALQGIALASVVGFLMALGYRFTLVRAFCAFIRSIHELFWALLFIQIAGLSSLTGLLAIAIPYAGTLAKIYGELFEEVDPSAITNLPNHNHKGSLSRSLSRFCYTVLPLAWRSMATYTSYRFECAIRSSAILGFVGLPTIGFHLETMLSEGNYSEAAAFFYALLLLIATLRFWLQKRLLPLYLIGAFYYLPPQAQTSWQLVKRFISEDIVPAPLRGQSNLNAESLGAFGQWFNQLWQHQIWPGLVNTMLLGQIVLVFTGLLALLLFPLNSPLFFRGWRGFGDAILILLRTLPEYLLAFLGLLIFGPSMVPAILALGIHNGAIIGHLVGRHTDELTLRADAGTGLNLYFYEVLPRIYRQFLAFLFYRWEVVLRETAILGILGIATLGFYIDSAFEEFRFDRALILILASAMLNIGVDNFARWLRQRLHLKSMPESL
ncbi:ABC transporter permease [Porticoccaceae bacterium]|nr:ABC transporter permease [Porticoccaceae bacterium]